MKIPPEHLPRGILFSFLKVVNCRLLRTVYFSIVVFFILL